MYRTLARSHGKRMHMVCLEHAWCKENENEDGPLFGPRVGFGVRMARSGRVPTEVFAAVERPGLVGGGNGRKGGGSNPNVWACSLCTVLHCTALYCTVLHCTVSRVSFLPAANPLRLVGLASRGVCVLCLTRGATPSGCALAAVAWLAGWLAGRALARSVKRAYPGPFPDFSFG